MPEQITILPTGKYLARIVEEECIGCTLCIKACPFDAIIGASKHMHTVLSQYCTGCRLCIPPCPVDCIVLEKNFSFNSACIEKDAYEIRELKNTFAKISRENKMRREQRLKRIKQEKQDAFERKKHELLNQ